MGGDLVFIYILFVKFAFLVAFINEISKKLRYFKFLIFTSFITSNLRNFTSLFNFKHFNYKFAIFSVFNMEFCQKFTQNTWKRAFYKFETKNSQQVPKTRRLVGLAIVSEKSIFGGAD